MSAVAGFGVGFLPRRWPLRFAMAVDGACCWRSARFGLIGVHSVRGGLSAGGLFGLGIGGVMTLLPVAWADYFGRESFGAIRGVALSLQMLAQAAGPLVSGALRDWSGRLHVWSLTLFGGLGRPGGVLAALRGTAAACRG